MINFNLVKETRDIETNELKGYNADGMYVPIDPSNRHYREIQEWIKQGNQPEPAFTEEERLNYFKNSRLQKLLNLADRKTQEVKNTLAGFAVTPEQAERYKIKYQKAIEAINANDYTYFQPEADLTGKDPKTLANEVKQAGDIWNAEIDKQIALIEAYRVKAKEIINSLTDVNQFTIVDKYLKEAETITSIDVDTLKAIFSNFETDLNNLS